MKTPPDKQWKLLELAYEDFKSVEQDPAYHVDMMVFHVKHQNFPKCVVCLAGAVMARTLESPATAALTPFDFSYPWESALCTISDIALGDPPRYAPDVVKDFAATNYKPYVEDPAQWHNYIAGLIKLLKELDI